MSKDTDTQALSLESGFDEWYASRPYTREVLNPQGYARMVWRAASKHRAALAAAEAQPDHIPEAGKMVQPVAVPQGWKLAPMEPTVGMCIAGDEARANVDDLTRTPAIYRAMLAAAPAAPAPALAPQGLPDPLGCNACTHPSCGRYGGPRSVECRAMADNACARPTERADGIGGEA